MFDTVIAGGLIVTAEESYRSDIGISGERIAAIAPVLAREGALVVDAAGKYVFPGGVDVHTHLDMPLDDITTADDFETGTRAAAFGGTTTIIDFAVQEKGESLHQAVERWMSKAESAAIDYGFHCIITDLTPALDEIPQLACEGITSFKVFMAYPGRLMLQDAAILELLRAAAPAGALVCVHAENGPAIEINVRQALAAGHTAPKYHALTRPPCTEAEATGRVIALAEKAEAPIYIVHVSCEEALEEIRKARERGLLVLAETCPQYLFLSIDDFDASGFEGAKYVLTPPLREERNHDKLWQGLKSGVLQAVSTDHCAFNFRGQKDRSRQDFTRIPNGVPGIEHRLALLYTGGVVAGRFSVNRLVELVSTAPARIFGLYPRKGTIAVGSDADLVIFDPARQHTISASTHHMRVDYNLYEGITVTGVPDVVFSRGSIITESGKFLGEPGAGRFLKRSPFSLD